MNIDTLLSSWSLPDRTNERTQLTLRIDYDLYARLHALKSIYPRRSVNDMINDIIKIGLDDIVSALPFRELSVDEAALEGFFDEFGQPERGIKTGKRIEFDQSYRSILEKKPLEESDSEVS